MKDFTVLKNYINSSTLFFLIIILGAFFYGFKNFKILDNQIKLFLVIIIVGSIAGILTNVEGNKNVKSLTKNFNLTTGSIEEYNVTKIKGRGNTGNSIKYIYSIDNHFFVHSYGENYFIDIPDDKPNLSLLYLVIYEKTNPKNSFILLNYPIKNQDDLEKYRKLFVKKIPEDAIKLE